MLQYYKIFFVQCLDTTNLENTLLRQADEYRIISIASGFLKDHCMLKQAFQ